MKRKLVYLVIVAGIIFFQKLFMNNYYLKGDVLSSFLTFLSIIFGFYITSLSIFVTSKYVSDLYKVVDKNDHSLTLLHSLVRNYRRGLIFVLISIGYFVFIQFLISQNIDGKIILSNKWLILFMFFIVGNFWYSYKMLNDLINVIIQEAKNNSVI